MKTAVVQNNSLLDSGRIDPSYHLSESIKLKKRLLASPYTLSTVGEKSEDVFLGNIFTRVFVKDAEHGVPYIAASDMTKSSVDSGKFISKKQAKKLKRLMLNSGWILISCSGTLGNVVYTNDLFKNTFATHDLIRLIPDDKKMPSGFLYAYLASKYGYTLLTQSGFGGVVKHINSGHVANIPVPLFSESKQQEIHNLIVESANLRVEANRLLDKAQEKFVNSNKLSFSKSVLDPQEKAFGNIYSIKNISPLSFKARNYSIRAQEIITTLSNTENTISLEDFLEKPFSMGSRASFKRITNSNFKGIDIVSQGDIHQKNPLKFKQVKPKKIENSTVERKMIIMPSAGTLGENEVFTRPLLIRNNFEGKLLSEVIGVFECKTEEDAAYLYNFLSSKALFRVLRTIVYGTNLLYPNWELMKNIKVPICSNSDYGTIVNITLNAFDCRGNANNKENQAIFLVEKEIESWQQS
jgi:restriction endonuclease S subunit